MAQKRLDSEIHAAAWATEILNMPTHKNLVKPQDRPYIEAVLTQVGLMENPMKNLSVAILDTDNLYEITIKGWQQRMSDRRWTQTFLAENTRDDMMKHVKDTYISMVDNKVIRCIEVNKVQFQTVGQTPRKSSAPVSRRFSKRD
jgi:hypothetical protein